MGEGRGSVRTAKGQRVSRRDAATLFSFLRQVYVPGGPHMMHMRLYSIPVASPALPAAAAHRERPALKPQVLGEAVPLGRLPAHVGGHAFGRIGHQNIPEKVPCCGRHVWLNRPVRRLEDPHRHLSQARAPEGREPVQQLVHEGAHRPHVDGRAAVGVPAVDLRRHVLWGAAYAAEPAVGVAVLGEAEIAKLDSARRRRRGVGSVAGKATAEAVADNLRPLPEASHAPTSIPPRHLRHIRVQYVVGFDVSVRHAHPVQVRQRSGQLCRQRSRLRWRHPLAPDPMPGHPPLQRAPPTVFE
eukprot:scaffold6967_cov123-Isochrysis_galbana.AAC.2